MYKINKTKTIIISSAVLAFIIAYIFLFLSVNARFPQNKRVIYNLNESFVTQGAEFKITGANLLNESEIKKDTVLMDFLIQSHSGYADAADLRIAVMDVKILNPGKQALNIDLTAFHLETGAFSLQFYLPLMKFFNETGMYITLGAGEEKEFKMPVPIVSINFLDYDFNKIENRDYFLVYSLYPEKNMVSIKFDKNN